MKQTTRGKYTDIREGQLSFTPDVKRVGPFNNKTRKSVTYRPKNFKEGLKSRLPEEVPGWKDWRGRIRAAEIRLMKKGSVGRPAGLPDGMTKAEMEEHLREIETMMTQDELCIAIQKQLETENPIVQLTMRFNLEVLMGNYGLRERQAASRELSTYYKTKPVVETKVKISKEEEDWESDLIEFASKRDSEED